jgi:hypothetical protein
MPYESRCEILKLDTLQKRSDYFSPIKCYKTVFGINGISFDEVVEFRHIRKLDVIINIHYTQNYLE